MNNLRHGLCSNQVVLPGESAEEFNAGLKGWRTDWRPGSHTAAVLVERAAVASWRLRRCVRAESDLLLELADRKARRRDRNENDDDIISRDRQAEESLLNEPAEALAELKSCPEGVDRLIRRWERLGDELDEAAEEWGRGHQHSGVTRLLGHDPYAPDADPAAAGPLAAASWRLVAENERRLNEDEDGDRALSDAEVAELVVPIRRGIAREVEALRALRKTLASPSADDGDGDDLKFVGVSKRIMLLHRYEMSIERSMRGAMKDLLALEKARPDLGSVPVAKTEVFSAITVEKSAPEATAALKPGSPSVPDEPEPGVGSVGSEGAREGFEGGSRADRRPRKGRSRV